MTICAVSLSALEKQAVLVHPYTALEPAIAVDTTVVRDGWHNERLEYEIYWGLINVGSAYRQIDKIVMIDGRTAYHIISGAKSAAFINNFYTVNDINESWMDIRDLYSFGYRKSIREGHHFFDEWVIFDNTTKTFHGEKMGKSKIAAPVEGTLDGPVNDVLSALYLVRTMDLRSGTSQEILINTKRNWRMDVKFRKREKESTAYGKFKCVLVEPQLGDDGLFVAKQGKKMLVWITDDELRLPLILKAEIFIGSVTAKLVKRRMN